jgi:hypothetical protein
MGYLPFIMPQPRSLFHIQRNVPSALMQSLVAGNEAGNDTAHSVLQNGEISPQSHLSKMEKAIVEDRRGMVMQPAMPTSAVKLVHVAALIAMAASVVGVLILRHLNELLLLLAKTAVYHVSIDDWRALTTSSKRDLSRVVHDVTDKYCALFRPHYHLRRRVWIHRSTSLHNFYYIGPRHL